jgi:hypothetical protein
VAGLSQRQGIGSSVIGIVERSEITWKINQRSPLGFSARADQPPGGDIHLAGSGRRASLSAPSSIGSAGGAEG